MKCVFCGGEVKKRMVEEEIKVFNDFILFEMEVDVCKSCNEKYYSEGQIDEMILLKKRLQKEKEGCKEIGRVYQLA